MESLTFGTNTAKDKYFEFLEEYNEYKKDETSIIKANNLSSSGWHLIDWCFEDYKLIHKCENIGQFRDSLYPLCSSLKIMHDLANSKKHKKLSRPKANLKNTKKHIGDYSDDYSSDYDISYLEIELIGGTKLSFADEIEKVKTFWDEYFSEI